MRKHGRPLLPFQRIRRETYNCKKQYPQEHIENLGKYLQTVHHLVPNDNSDLSRPSIRHPDLQPNNVFVSDNLEITGLIDWQHCAIHPLFLQCGIPNSLQNYSDSISESLKMPDLPQHFNELDEREQFEQVWLLRKRQLHYYYVTRTAALNPVHYNALSHNFGTLRRKLYQHASDPWEGDNVTLKADLIHLEKNWSKIVNPVSGPSDRRVPTCPIAFSEEEVSECLRLNAAQIEADEQFEACKDVIGVGSEGWVPSDQYEDAKEREKKLKADTLEGAETDDERALIMEHWIFDDFDEEEYL